MACTIITRSPFARKNKKDLTGQVFGLWKPVRYVGYLSGESRWECECLECGKLHIASSARLRKNGVRCPTGCSKRPFCTSKTAIAVSK